MHTGRHGTEDRLGGRGGGGGGDGGGGGGQYGGSGSGLSGNASAGGVPAIADTVLGVGKHITLLQQTGPDDVGDVGRHVGGWGGIDSVQRGCS